MVGGKKDNKSYEDKISKGYEYFDVTADVGINAYGESIEEAFENASIAMFNVMTNINTIEPKISKNIHIESEDIVSLLYDYLSELLFLSETELIFFKEFKISIKKIYKNKETIFKLEGIIKGETIDWNKHEHGCEVKAVTFHLMDVKKEDLFKVKVVLDL